MKIIITGPDEEARENFEADEPVYAVMVNGERWSYSAQSNVGAQVQDVIDSQARLDAQVSLVGQQVKHVSGTGWSRRPDGDVGRVTAYGRASRRYQVKWASGDEGWFPQSELEVI